MVKNIGNILEQVSTNMGTLRTKGLIVSHTSKWQKAGEL